MKPLILLICLAFFIPYAGFSQTQPQTTTTQPVVQPVIEKTTATFFAGAVFASRLHYYGRTDSLKSSALLPTVLIQFDSAHLYISGTAVFLNNKEQSMDYAGTVAEAGYKFGKAKGIAGNVYVNKFFYNTGQLPQSALKAQTGINLSHLNKIINITASGSAAFSDKTDFFSSAGLNKNFKWRKGQNVFVVTPTFVLNAGSQKFVTSKNKSNIPGIPLPGQEVIESSERFSILSYEMSVPLIYARKHVYFIVTPSYVVPENVVTVTNHPELSEKAANLFYTNVTVLFSFKK
jgi:hypothetical protein